MNQPATETIKTAEPEDIHPPRVPQIDKICIAAIRHGASDIHITPGLKPVLRLQGDLRPLPTSVVTTEIAKTLFDNISDSHAKLTMESEGQVDFAFTLNIGNDEYRAFRVNAVKSLHGIAITMRLISNAIPDPIEIGLSKKLLNVMTDGTGILLVTGKTGSGKSTTLASLLQWLANTTDRKIVTVEHPIEYRFAHGKSVVVQREVPNHAHSFSDTLKSMLRQDPDVIMVGELRELDEIRVALKAAESGHLVISTVHSKGAAETINRLVDVFPPDEQQLVKVVLSQTLLGIVSQDLLMRKDGHGRRLVYELMFNTPAIANHIREGKVQSIESTMQTSAREGMHTFDAYLMRILEAEEISLETAIQAARKKTEFVKGLRDRGLIELPQRDS